MKKEWLSIPNLMGYLRLFLAGVYLVLILQASSTADYYMAALVIGISMMTDFLDGKIARRFHMVTDLGKVLDPFADKVTLGVITLSFVWRYPLMETVLFVFLLKEGFMLIAGMLLMRHGWKTSGATMYGKVCTATMYLVGFLLLGFPDMSLLTVNLLLLLEILVMLITLFSYMESYLQLAYCFKNGARPEEIDYKALAKRRKRTHRYLKRGTLIALPCFIIYVFIGAIVPFSHPLDITTTNLDDFATEKYTSTSVGKDRAYVVEDNREALDLRLQMIAHAKKRILLSTFDIRTDEAGKDILSALLAAADRGVKVELFADGFNSWVNMEQSPYFIALSSHPNIKIILYNKINLLKPWSIMGRMHDKYLLVDETAYVLGGRNTFNYFLGSYEGPKNYDRDILVYNTGGEDSSLYELSHYYKTITSLDCCELFCDSTSYRWHPSIRRAQTELKEHYEALKMKKSELFDKEYDYLSKTCATNQIRILKNPIHNYAKEPVVFWQLMTLAREAKTDVTIHTPYVICDEDMYEGLLSLGKKTRILLNSAGNNGNLFAAVDYMSHKKELIDTLVQILEYEGGISYHGKSMVIDDHISVIGSFNFDMRSAYINTELMVVVDSRELNQLLRKNMAVYEEKSATVKDLNTYSAYPVDGIQREISTKKRVVKNLFGWIFEKMRFIL